MPLGQFEVVDFDEKRRLFGDKLMARKAAVKVDLAKDNSTLIKEWNDAQKELADIKSREHQLRIKLTELFFKAEKLEGTETVDIGWGWKMKAVKSLNITATDAKGELKALLEAVNQIDHGIAVGLVNWVPDIKTQAYRDLLALAEQHPALKALMAAAITVKPGMPQLALVEPKAEVAVDENVPLPATEGGTLTTDGTNVKW